jgi:hypothetical protein
MLSFRFATISIAHICYFLSALGNEDPQTVEEEILFEAAKRKAKVPPPIQRRSEL